MQDEHGSSSIILFLVAEVDKVLQGSSQLKSIGGGSTREGGKASQQTTHKLTREEKQQLLEQYGCQSSDEDDEYPFV